MSKKDLIDLAKNISKTYGENSLMYMGESPQIMENQKNRMLTGFYELDWGFGGGVRKGGMIELYGPEAAGKTTLAITLLAQAQKSDMQVLFVDAEHKLNVEYAQKLGVNIDELLVTQPSYGEQAVDITQAVMESGLINMVIIDSVTGLVPLVDINGDTTDANMGAHARLMSKMCRVLAPVANHHNIIVVFINQIRQKIGVFFGSPETTTGGNALKFWCGVRIRVSSKSIDGDDMARLVICDFKKMQWGRPFKIIQMKLNLGEGFDTGYDMVEHGLRQGIFTMAGSHVKFGKVNLGNGKLVAARTVGKYKKEFDEALNGKEFE